MDKILLLQMLRNFQVLVCWADSCSCVLVSRCSDVGYSLGDRGILV